MGGGSLDLVSGWSEGVYITGLRGLPVEREQEEDAEAGRRALVPHVRGDTPSPTARESHLPK